MFGPSVMKILLWTVQNMKHIGVDPTENENTVVHHAGNGHHEAKV